ncbi:hypothetical protein FOCC_FOCC017987 [Frankliniella occidentalis]|nr:hypothetical protein FOCC_FOCC017987 [Frankliniella occidentalis]
MWVTTGSAARSGSRPPPASHCSSHRSGSRAHRGKPGAMPPAPTLSAERRVVFLFPACPLFEVSCHPELTPASLSLRDLEITTELTERAPRPQLSVGVRQGGQPISGELNVNPGTPLQMDVYLDKASAPIYGLLVSYMQVTDTKNQEETIIFNGRYRRRHLLKCSWCSFDPHLFENFNTVDGDFLTAKFRAFKFPDSTFVQFKATVNVCLDKCQGVECSNGQVGYGRRRRRAVPDMSADPNAIYKVTMITFIKVDYSDDELLRKGPGNIIRADSELPPRRRNATPVLATNGLADVADAADSPAGQQSLQLADEHVREELAYTVVRSGDPSAASSVTASWCVLTLLLVAAATLRAH